MAIWSRNKIWGTSTFNTDVDVADNTNNASVVPTTSFFGFKFSTIVDATLIRSKWLVTTLAQSLRATVHKEEDRATSANLGVSGAEPTTTKYVTVEQLPSVDKETDDFTISAVEADGALTNAQDMFVINTVTTGTNKVQKVSFSTFAIKWLKVRTWLQTDLVTLITDTVNPLITAAINAIPSRVAPVTSLVSVSGTQTISSTGYVDVTGLTYTTPADGVTRKYFITYKGRIFQQCKTSLANEMYVKLYNSTDNLTFDESFYAQGISGLATSPDALSRNIQGYLMTIQTIAPNKVIKVAAKETINDGTNHAVVSESVLIIQEIK